MAMNPVQVLPIIVLFILGGPAVASSATLPDYQTAPKKEFIWLCDAETTRIHTDLYRAPDYYVAISATETGATVMSVYYHAEGRAQFLVKRTDSPDFVEVPRDAWQEKIRADMSPNYFKRIRNMQNDCTCITGCD